MKREEGVKSTARGYKRKFGFYPDTVFIRHIDGDEMVRVAKGVLVRVAPLPTVLPEHYWAVNVGGDNGQAKRSTVDREVGRGKEES